MPKLINSRTGRRLRGVDKEKALKFLKLNYEKQCLIASPEIKKDSNINHSVEDNKNHDK